MHVSYLIDLLCLTSTTFNLLIIIGVAGAGNIYIYIYIYIYIPTANIIITTIIINMIS